MAALVVAQQDGQHWHTWHEGPSPELQDAAPVPARALWRHHQHGKACVPRPAAPVLRISFKETQGSTLPGHWCALLAQALARRPFLNCRMQHPSPHVPSGATISIGKDVSLALQAQ